MKIMIGSIRPNPFDEGALDQKVVDDMKASLEETGLETVRLEGRISETITGFWECDDGKHRVAAIRALDPRAMIEFNMLKLSDAEMFQRLVYKNFVRRKPTAEEFKQIVLRARQLLLEKPFLCKCRDKAAILDKNLKEFAENGKLADARKVQSNHLGSTVCIAAFLKVRHQKVSEALNDRSQASKSPTIPIGVCMDEETPTVTDETRARLSAQIGQIEASLERRNNSSEEEPEDNEDQEPQEISDVLSQPGKPSSEKPSNGRTKKDSSPKDRFLYGISHYFKKFEDELPLLDRIRFTEEYLNSLVTG